MFQIIGNFHGHGQWHFVDNCLEVGAGLTAFPGEFATPSSIAPVGITPLSEADATSDLSALANEIEERLDLRAVEPKSFSEALLTREGLRKSWGAFEDFEDGGQRIAYLIVQPEAWGSTQPTSAEITKADIMLHFEPHLGEMTAILGDIVGSYLTLRNGGTLTEEEAEKIERHFPVFWKISEYYEDAYLSPQEAELLVQECMALDKVVSSAESLRGVDKLTRIARWASTSRYGVLLSAP